MQLICIPSIKVLQIKNIFVIVFWRFKPLLQNGSFLLQNEYLVLLQNGYLHLLWGGVGGIIGYKMGTFYKMGHFVL